MEFNRKKVRNVMEDRRMNGSNNEAMNKRDKGEGKILSYRHFIFVD